MTLNLNHKKSQQGSIMLEVIAVLALMGVMGAMLFRQIYQRNQELHNIQMASEIRTVKEAFSAYIQAHSAEILETCKEEIPDVGEDTVEVCNAIGSDLDDGISEYLPDGWFSDGGLSSYYTFSLWSYRQLDDSAMVKMYGVIIPKTATLPSTGWNFKRAARVALLVGADGGAYAKGITQVNDSGTPEDAIAGSLGTWHLYPVNTDYAIPKDGTNEMPTYVAITGLDNFTPEYEKEEVKVTLQHDLDLLSRKLHAYEQFSVGKDNTGCFDDANIHHDDAEVDENGVSIVYSDTVSDIPGTCLPTFWVQADQTGNVYTRNDLIVGYDTDDPSNAGGNKAPAIRLSKEGVIVFKDTVVDPQETDSTKKEKSYVLDPAYTSVMNDVKLMSRGGARLSDILPNYILKEQAEKTCTIIAANSSSCQVTMSYPTCPAGYTKALVITPQNFGKNFVKKTLTISGNTSTTGSHTHGTSGTETAGEHEHSFTDVTADFPQAQFSVSTDTDDTNSKWNITLGYGANVEVNEDVSAIAQSYCVFDVKQAYGSEATCEAAGYTWTTECTLTRKEIKRAGNAANNKIATTKYECQALGGTWNTATDPKCTLPAV